MTIDGTTYDLTPVPGAAAGTFTTGPLDLPVVAGDTVTATYVDPSNASDTSSASVTIVAAQFTVERFYAGPSPFSDGTSFGFVGTGLAAAFDVAVYDLAGRLVWSATAENVLSIPWDGRNADGEPLANGAYVYRVQASGGDGAYNGQGKVFIQR